MDLPLVDLAVFPPTGVRPARVTYELADERVADSLWPLLRSEPHAMLELSRARDAAGWALDLYVETGRTVVTYQPLLQGDLPFLHALMLARVALDRPVLTVDLWWQSNGVRLRDIPVIAANRVARATLLNRAFDDDADFPGQVRRL